MEEIWKEYPKCADYLVSTLGRVKSMERIVSHAIRGTMKVEEKFLIIQNVKHGYQKVHLSIHKVKKKFYLHRILAETFIPNPENKPQINHKNGIRNDNRLENLEWCTNGENTKHSYRVLGRKSAKIWLGIRGELHFKSKKIYCPTLGMYFGGAKEASRQLGIGQGSISHVCNGRQPYTQGLTFRYV